MLRFTNRLLFLYVALLSLHFHPSRCSLVFDCEPEPFAEDRSYEDNKQELAHEIDDVNNYMQSVADQLTNDVLLSFCYEALCDLSADAAIHFN